MLQIFTRLLERFFAFSDTLQEKLSAKWREHSNRRTIVILVCAGAAAAYLYVAVIQPPDDFPAGELVSVPAGEPLARIGRDLEKQGVIRSPLAFRLLIVILGRERGAHAGDYLFKEPENVWQIARAVSIGAYGLEPIRIRIPEGARTKDMAAIFDAALLRFDRKAFLAEAVPLEGYFFPDTYFFLPNATEGSVIQAMRQNFDEHEARIDGGIKKSGHSLAEIVVVASILEREADNPADRRMIAGVVWNRLARGMPLQMDATFLYTLGKGTFQLTLKDLRSDSPYNTYKNKGLPPTPIGSPSLDSLEAAANPTKSGYLYYLADRDGITHYSKNFEEHARKKRLYLGT